MTAEPKRYMGGKLPNKYFMEDLWPVYVDLFLKLNITEYKGLLIFKGSDAFLVIECKRCLLTRTFCCSFCGD
jgi:hypothetical protein